MKPIKSLTSMLEEAVVDIPWGIFEEKDDGHVRLEVEGYPQDFYCRAGLHMQQPRQVLISCGKFLRVKGFPDPKEYNGNLIRIDAKKPSQCLYMTNNVGLASSQLSTLYGNYNPNYLSNIYSTNVGSGGYGLAQSVPLEAPQYHWDPRKPYEEQRKQMLLYQSQMTAQQAQLNGQMQYGQYTNQGIGYTSSLTTPTTTIPGLQALQTPNPYDQGGLVNTVTGYVGNIFATKI